jgi:single-stranded DNA-binding protein
MEFWDTLAHVAGQHLKKGDQIYVTGYLKVDVYLKDEVQQKITRVCHL